MRTVPLGTTGTLVPNVVAGLMRISDKTDDEIRELVRTARDSGIDFFDHADIYGTRMHQCEERFAEAMQLSPSERAEITIQTKTGIVREGPYFDFSYERIVTEVEGSLPREATMRTLRDFVAEHMAGLPGCDAVSRRRTRRFSARSIARATALA